MPRIGNTLIIAQALLLILVVSPAHADTASQKALTAQSLQMWSTGDLSNTDKVFRDTYQNHQEPDVAGGPKTVDLADWSALVKGFHTAFPQNKVEILLQVGEGQFVTTRWRFNAVQKGDYLGLAPTGKTIRWTGIQIDRFEEGKIAESWVNWDMYSMFKQLGIIK
ncbi:MAG: ester cyclase [Stappiaceae bacterium]